MTTLLTPAIEINEAHRLARSFAETAVEHAIRCGQLLLEKKAAMRHGEWIPWIEANCEFDRFSAAKYMKAANVASTAHLDSDGRLALSREIWGNKHRRQKPDIQVETPHLPVEIGQPDGDVQIVLAKETTRTTRRRATQDEKDGREWDEVITFLTTRVREPEDEFGIHEKTLSGKRLKNAAEYLAKMYIADAGVSDISIPLKDGSRYHPTVTDIEVWQSAFPTLDIEEQLRQIAAWNDANPAKRKTKAGIKGHIFSWLSNVGRRSAFGSGQCDVDENAGRHQAL